MRMVKKAFATLLVGLSLTAYANVTDVKLHGLPIKIGDSIATAQKALGTQMKPEPYQPRGSATAAPHKQQLRLKTRGIWVIFDRDKVNTIRIDPPFAGDVGGIKLGDPDYKIAKAFGRAVKKGSLGSSTYYQYYFNDVTTTQFVVNNSGALETIFLLK